MRITLVAFENIDAGDLVYVTDAAAGRCAKCVPNGTFEQSTAVGMAQNAAAAGNVVTITTDGPSQPGIYSTLVVGEDYYVGVDARLARYDEFKTAMESGSYPQGFLIHCGIAATESQLALDLEQPFFVVTSAL